MAMYKINDSEIYSIQCLKSANNLIKTLKIVVFKLFTLFDKHFEKLNITSSKN